MTTAIISAVAVVVAAASLRASRAADRRGRMPVLVYIFDDERGFGVQNVGKGPAINIVIAQGRGPDRIGGVIWGAHAPASWWDRRWASVALKRSGMGEGESWINPIHLSPMSSDAFQPIPWALCDRGIGITYTDALGYRYTMRMSRYGSSLKEYASIPQWLPHERVKIDYVNTWAKPRALASRDWPRDEAAADAYEKLTSQSWSKRPPHEPPRRC